MKKRFWTWLYELKYTLQGIRRHIILTLSALSVVTVILFLIGIFVITATHVEQFSLRMEDSLKIHVVLENAIDSSEDIQEIKHSIKNIEGVKKVIFSSRDDELDLMIKEKGEAFKIYKGEENPLSNAFFVQAEEGESIPEISKQIEKVFGVNQVAYGGKTTVQFVSLLHKIRWAGYVGFILLIVLSLYLIYNTIRTSITIRSDEIIIMRQVGAEDTFIRRPFEWEGLLIGIVGALFSAAILWGLYAKFYEIMKGRLFAYTFTLLPVSKMSLYVVLSLLICGVGIGLGASLMATAKYIKEKR